MSSTNSQAGIGLFQDQQHTDPQSRTAAHVPEQKRCSRVDAKNRTPPTSTPVRGRRRQHEALAIRQCRGVQSQLSCVTGQPAGNPGTRPS